MFQPFALVNALYISEYVAPLWAAAKEEYGRRMHPIEDRLSQKLKELFGSVLIPSLTAAVSKHGERGGLVAQPHQVFREFKRYGGLLSRPLISERLQVGAAQSQPPCVHPSPVSTSTTLVVWTPNLVCACHRLRRTLWPSKWTSTWKTSCRTFNPVRTRRRGT